MRAQIINTLFDRMATNPDIFFLTADMGINLVERFAEKYPDRFLNVGIAEQNLVGVSAGLVNIGFRPFAYTISNFAVHRCFEQIRNEIGIHDYPVILLGTSTGYDNASLGPTHHMLDDWGSIKAIPEIDIYCPSSVAYAGILADHLIDIGRPAYVRIPKRRAQDTFINRAYCDTFWREERSCPRFLRNTSARMHFCTDEGSVAFSNCNQSLATATGR